MDERNSNALEHYEDQLDKLLALLELLRAQGELRYFDGGDYAALQAAKEALGAEIFQHRGDNV